MLKKIRACGVVLLVAAVIAGCSSGGGSGNSVDEGISSGGSSESGSGNGLTDVTVGLVAQTMSAFVFYAQDSGIFKKHGLNVNTVTAASPIEVAAAMSSGKDQFGFITTPVLVNANISGAGMKCVAPVVGQASKTVDSVALVSSKNSGITSLKDFSNKRLAVIQLGSINRLAMQILLTRAGATDVHYVAIPFPQMPQALASGRVDGAVIVEPFSQSAIKAGAHVLAHPNAQLYGGGTIYCYAATSKYLGSSGSSKTAEAFQASMKESILYAKKHSSVVLKSLVKHMGMSQKGALAQQMPTNFVPVINTKSISEIQSQMKAEGWIKKTVDPTNMVWSPGK